MRLLFRAKLHKLSKALLRRSANTQTTLPPTASTTVTKVTMLAKLTNSISVMALEN